MLVLAKQPTVEVEPSLYQALRNKSEISHRSVSDLVNDAIREALREDQEDLAAFNERAGEGTISYQELVGRLQADGTL